MESLRDLLRSVLPDKVRERALGQMKAAEANWRETEKKLRDLLPLVNDFKAEDLIFNSDVIGEAEERKADCAKCNPDSWPTDGTGSPCQSPLVPVVTRSKVRIPAQCPVCRLKVAYVRCRMYQDWAAKRNQPDQPAPRRSYSKKRWKPYAG